MSSVDAGKSGIGESWRLNSEDSINSESDNVLMRTCVSGWYVMFEVDSKD